MLLELQNLGKSFGEHEVLRMVWAAVGRGDASGILVQTAPGKPSFFGMFSAIYCFL